MPGTPTRSRLVVFRALLLALPLLFFLTLEGGLRLFDYGGNLDLFVPAEPDGSGRAYLMTNPEVARRYFSRVGRTPRPPYDVFLREKPVDGYRIFMLGGSTVAGWPYPENVMSSRVLGGRLSDAFPERHIEVVNVGIAAVNSFTLLDFVDELLAFEPDAVIIYAGHNEFYGAFGAASAESLGKTRWIVNTYVSLLELRTVRLLRDAIDAMRGWPADSATRTEYAETHPTLMSRMIASNVPYGSDLYQAAGVNFARNLDEILEELTRSGVSVLVSELVSNIRDMPPLASVEIGEYPPADAVFREARSFEEEGSYDAARTAYETARDLDALRFRASEDFNRVIHQTARTYGVPVVPMKDMFEAASPNGLIGSTLMLEHLHPNVEGYFLMADAYFRAMRDNDFIAAEWNRAAIRPAAWYAENWPVTDLDRALGRLRVMDLMDYWPFAPLSEPGDRFRTFEPATPAEAIALRVVKDELDFVQAHIEMADVYTAAGDLESASREHAALAAADPYDGR